MFTTIYIPVATQKPEEMMRNTVDRIIFDYLADRQDAVPTVAKWYFDEWGFEDEKRTLETEINDLKESLNKRKIPLTIVASLEGEIIGTAQLKWKEMSIFPDRKYWLGGVFVREENRGNGIAAQMVKELTRAARSILIKQLFLLTERLDGGLYGKMGWQGIERVNYMGSEVLVMEKNL